MYLRRISATLLAVALAAVAPSTAAPAPGPAPASQAPEKPVTITLITGDRVIVSAHGTAYEHAPGRAGIRSMSWTADGHQYVIPIDALPLIRQGRLDQRLFDVTVLREFGYAGDTELPLLVAYPKTGKSKGPSSARAAVGTTAHIGRDLARLSLLPMRASRTARAALWNSLTRGTASARALRPGIERVYLDGKLKLNLDVSVPQIGAPAAWQQGLDGTGVTVAVLDTGIDATHPDLAGKIVASENFTSDPSTDDRYGHGTHIASIIAGSGAGSGGKYRGVAPGAKLAIGKVCTTAYCGESDVLAGMQWAAKIAPVVNMSLGGYDDAGIDPLEQAVDDLTAEYGALFVIAAGNRGLRGSGTVDSPASADSALAVGAVDYEDQLAGFSGRGPRVGDGAVKPDITAPGVNITAARAANGTIGDPAADGYVNMDGTSMATPHVAGAAAIAAQLHPSWSPKQRKNLLMGAANPTSGVDVFGQGAGRVDVARAVGQSVSVDEGSVNFGQQEWPHDDDTPITKTLTYRNGGIEPVVLTLAVEGDTGTFSGLADRSLTVPAGGTATTTVTADTSGRGTDGFKSARVVATGPGDVRVETPMGVNRDVEKYNVTLRHVGRDGQPNLEHWGGLIPLDKPGAAYDFYYYAAEQTVLVPKGTYGLFSQIYEPAGTTMLVQTKLVVDGATTITLDARQGRPVTITPPRTDARQATAAVSAYWTTNSGTNSMMTAESVTPGDVYVAQIGPKEKLDGFYGSVSSVFAQWKNDDEGFRDSPYSYETAYFREGDFFTGIDKRISSAELARVKPQYASDAEGATGVKYNWASLDSKFAWTVGLPFSLPAKRTEYLSTEGGVSWQSTFEEQVQADPESFPETTTHSSGPGQPFEPGRKYEQDWNRAVFAPSVAGDVDLDLAVREKNEITADIPLFSDGSGHEGRSLTMDTARTALYSGGTLIGAANTDHGEFEVPAERKDYRLEMSVTRSAPFRLSTSVSGMWTFSSARGDTSLPLSTVRFSPRLDDDNKGPAGRFAIPITVERSTGSAAATNGELTAEFSADDGKTWRPATVSGVGDQRTLLVTNPASGFVSLRVNTTDTAGNTATVTAIRAYAVE